MEVLYPRCCGLDVHKETVVACLRLVIDGKVVKEVRTFSTTTASLMDFVGVADRKPVHAYRNGSDWCLLEACLAHLIR
jgi:hypothetical protein